MRQTIAEIEEFKRKAQEECDEKIRAHVRPLIVAEFARVKKRNSKLQRIIFGNGGWLADFTDDSSYQWADDAPKYMQRLFALCDSVAGVGVDDVE